MKITTLDKGFGRFYKCVSYLITELENFDIKQIAKSGQAFRFTDLHGSLINEMTDDKLVSLDTYCVSACGEYCEVYQVGDSVDGIFVEIACTGNVSDWLVYFDIIDCDGNEICTYENLVSKILKSNDKPLKEAVYHSNGIRILQQDFLETGISFITSCANNIPRISKLISKLCKAYGNFVEDSIDDYRISYWTFPSIESLRKVTEEDLRQLGFGFRAPHIIEFIQYYDALPLDYVPSYKDLQTVNGIGPKVASCILLYSFHELDRVPMDVWMNRFQSQLYAGKLTWKEFSPYRGICQQYLYYHFRK